MYIETLHMLWITVPDLVYQKSTNFLFELRSVVWCYILWLPMPQ